MSDLLTTTHPLDFLDALDPVRSASPHPDREPEKRGLPPTPPPEPPKAERVKAGAFSPEAVETYRKSQQLAIDVTGVFNTRVFIGKSADGRTAPGALPWHWCYGRQPVHVKGAVYSDSDEGRHLARGITEAQAQRMTLAETLAGIGSVPLSRSSVLRHLKKAGR